MVPRGRVIMWPLLALAFLWLGLHAWARRIAPRFGGIASTLAVVAFSGFMAACGGGGSGSGHSLVSDSAGITVVANLGPDRRFPATPVRVASLQPPDSALTAMPWGVVADPSSGTIFVADGTSERVVVFEPNGTFVRTIGRAGEGPGEFRSATALALDEHGALAVWDAGRGVISRWSAEGELLDERRAPVSYWGPGFAIRGDGVLAVTQATTRNQRRQSLVESRNENPAAELFAVTTELVQMDLPGLSMPAPRIFAPDLIWTTAGDTVLVLNGPEYRIDAYADGRHVTSIRRDIGSIAVTAELARARVGTGPYRAFMRRAGITPDQMVAAVGYEELASPIEWIVTTPSRAIWVSRGSGLPVPDRVDVFGPDGRYEGTFDAPGFPVAFLSDSLFVVLEITDLGEPVLSLYSLGRTESSASSARTSVLSRIEGGPRRSEPAPQVVWRPPSPDDELESGDEFRDCGKCDRHDSGHPGARR